MTRREAIGLLGSVSAGTLLRAGEPNRERPNSTAACLAGAPQPQQETCQTADARPQDLVETEKREGHDDEQRHVPPKRPRMLRE